jgi:CubicO group peptidase (beta-lactamase class C family)
VLGLAIDDGKIDPSLTQKPFNLMASFAIPPDSNASAGRELITIAQLATHTAGFDKPGGYVPIIHTPGTTWDYSDAGLNWLADTLTEVYQRDLSDLATERVWTPLGVTADDIRWQDMQAGFRKDPRAANPTLQYRELASGISANVNAMARVGLLFLRKGMWNGQRIVSPDFVTRVQTPLTENAGMTLDDPTGFPNATHDYGVLWWTNHSGQMANVPKDTYWAWGLGEALIVVIPSLDLVIVRNGDQVETEDPHPVPGRVWNDDGWNGDVSVLEPFLDPIVAGTTP